MLMGEGSPRDLLAQPAPSGVGLEGVVCQPAVTGCCSSVQPRRAGSHLHLFWQVKDLAGFPKGEPSLLPLNPPEARGELITVYVCTVIPHEPLSLWSSQADC